MIKLNRSPNTRLLELGGGSHPIVFPECMGGVDVHVDTREVMDSSGKRCVDIIHDLSIFPWPLKDNEFDGVIGLFVLEHVSYVHTSKFLDEVFRVSKPGSKSIFLVPNTENQVKWILEHPDGWDGKDFFTSASEKLFGSQDDTIKEQEVSKGNFHCVYLNPQIVTVLFSKAGFVDVLISPYGERSTDMSVQVVKPMNVSKELPKQVEEIKKENVIIDVPKTAVSQLPVVKSPYDGPNKSGMTSEDRAKLFGREYFDKYPGSRQGYYWDFIQHEVTARKVLERKPESVLELGCARGYVLKRLEDAGVKKCCGLDISKHSYLTRVSDSVCIWDVCRTPWVGSYIGIPPYPDSEDKKLDLCLSISFLEHIPEQLLPIIISEMERVSRRGLHGITFEGQETHPDNTRCTLRSKEWWQSVLPKNHEVFSVQELENGSLSDEYFNGDGRTKISVGTAWTMFHYGWKNLDIIDANPFASAYRYNFKQVDVRKGLPFSTGVVDLIFASHFLEHISYSEGLTFLRECRRVIRPDGAMRLIMPDAKYLMECYVEEKDEGKLLGFGEVNLNCSTASTAAGKIWALLHDGHNCCYDSETLCKQLEESGWVPEVSFLRSNKSNSLGIAQILKETVEMSYGYSLFVNAVPRVE